MALVLPMGGQRKRQVKRLTQGHAATRPGFCRSRRQRGACPADPLLQAGLEGLQETAGIQRPLVAWERKLLGRTRLPTGKAVGEEPQCRPAVSVWKPGGQRGARSWVSKAPSHLAPNTAPAILWVPPPQSPSRSHRAGTGQAQGAFPPRVLCGFPENADKVGAAPGPQKGARMVGWRAGYRRNIFKTRGGELSGGPHVLPTTHS